MVGDRHNRTRYAIIGFLIVLFFSLVLYTRKSFFYWDEIVYIGMSKYLLYGGNAGLFEMIRPPIVAIMLMPFAWIDMDPVLLYRLIGTAVSAALLWLMFIYIQRHISRRAAIVAVLAFALTSVFIKYSFRISAGNLSLLFMFIALLLLDKRRYVLVGFFAAMSFLARFPMGIFALSLGIVFTSELICELLSSEKGQKKRGALMRYLKGSALMFAGFIVPTAAYLIVNILRSPDKPWMRAALDPFFYASTAITGGYLWLYEQGFFYYALELAKQMPLIVLWPLAMAYLIWLQFKTRRHLFKENLMISASLILFLYFSQLAHKELRYGIVFLPAMFIVIVFAIKHLAEHLASKKKEAQRLMGKIYLILIASLALFSIFVFFHYNPLGLFQQEQFPAEVTHSFACYDFLDRYTDAPTVATNPYPAAFITNKIIPSYFTLSGVAEKYHDEDFLILTPGDFPCQEEDRACRLTNDKVIYDMVKVSDVIFYDPEPSRECIILTKQNITGISEQEKQRLKDMLLKRFAYQELVEVSMVPYAKQASVLLVLNDIVPVEDDGIWEERRFSALVTMLEQKDLPYTMAVIPTSLEKLDDDRLFVLQRLLDRNDIDIAQKGYDYTAQQEHDTFAGLPLAEQESRVREGKEIIYRYLFVRPDSFFVPFAESDQNTVKALIDNGFTTIMTSVYDTVLTADMQRLDVGVESVLDWEAMRIIPLADLKRATQLQTLSPYILVNLYYYTIHEEDMELVSEYLDWLSNKYHMATISQYNEWQRRMNMMSYKLTEDEFIIQNVTAYKEMPIGLLVRGPLNLDTNLKTVYVRNIGFDAAQVCINDVCDELEQEEIGVFDSFQPKR